MKKLILMFLLSLISAHSQSLIWEKETELEYGQYFSLQPSIMDKDSNILCITGPDYKPLDKSVFYKYDVDGNLLLNFNQETAAMEYPVSFYENDTGLIFFGGYNDKHNENGNSLPFTRKRDINGKEISISFPYWNLPKEQISNYSFIIADQNLRFNSNPTVTDNNNFYNISFVDYEKINDTLTAVGIFRATCYDTSGKVVWRKDLDTIGSINIFVIDFIYSNTGKFIVNILSDRNSTEQEFKYIEFDSSGTILQKNVNLIDKIINPLTKIYSTNKGYSYLLVHRSVDDDKMLAYKLMKLNNYGEIVQETEIFNKNLGLGIDGFAETPQNELIFWGSTLTVDTDTNDWDDNVYNSIFIRYDKNLKFISTNEFNQFTIYKFFKIKKIHFINDNDFISVGCKDGTKFYIARYSAISSVSENNKNEHFEFNIFPNPTNDFITIQTAEVLESSDVYNIQIFNTLGIEVISTPSPRDTPQEGNFRIDISGLLPGVYFIMIGDKVEKFIKM